MCGPPISRIRIVANFGTFNYATPEIRLETHKYPIHRFVVAETGIKQGRKVSHSLFKTVDNKIQD